MPPIFLCRGCKREVLEDQKYVVAAEKDGVQDRMHPKCFAEEQSQKKAAAQRANRPAFGVTSFKRR